MNQQEKGWASYGRHYKSLDEIRRAYAVRFTGYAEDAHGPVWTWVAEDVTDGR